MTGSLRRFQYFCANYLKFFVKTRACFNNFESTLSVTRPLDLGAKICSPLTILTDLSISVMKIYEKMVSSICQRLLDKQWELYEVY